MSNSCKDVDLFHWDLNGLLLKLGDFGRCVRRCYVPFSFKLQRSEGCVANHGMLVPRPPKEFLQILPGSYQQKNSDKNPYPSSLNTSTPIREHHKLNTTAKDLSRSSMIHMSEGCDHVIDPRRVFGGRSPQRSLLCSLGVSGV